MKLNVGQLVKEYSGNTVTTKDIKVYNSTNEIYEVKVTTYNGIEQTYLVDVKQQFVIEREEA